ncbi:hypothetical protein HK104_002520 [Borealophlyctis nickersoniae]|nr:hypothetical protein HK104_002520 [Borealophlyctis nickersoniae]
MSSYPPPLRTTQPLALVSHDSPTTDVVSPPNVTSPVSAVEEYGVPPPMPGDARRALLGSDDSMASTAVGGGDDHADITPRKGLWTRIWPSGRWSRTTLAYVLFEFVAITALQTYLIYAQKKQLGTFWRHDPELQNGMQSEIWARENAAFVYHVAFTVAQLFQVVVAWDAVLQKNILQIFALVLYSAGCVGYAVIQYVNNQELDVVLKEAFDNTRTMVIIEWIVFGLELASTFILAILSKELFKEFGWTIFRQYGADLRIRRAIRDYHILVLLLKFALFFLSLFVSVLLALVSNVSIITEILTGAVGVPLALGTVAMGWWGLKRESKGLMGGFVTGCVLGIGFVIARIARMYIASKSSDYRYARRYLTFFGVICLLTLCGCIVYAGITTRRFGTGLRKFLSGPAILDEEEAWSPDGGAGMEKEKKRRKMDLEE